MALLLYHYISLHFLFPIWIHLPIFFSGCLCFRQCAAERGEAMGETFPVVQGTPIGGAAVALGLCSIWCLSAIIMTMIMFIIIIEGSLEVKLPTIWTDEKQRWEESEKRREEKRRSKKRKSQKKEDPGARKGRKVAKHCFFNDLRLRRVEK